MVVTRPLASLPLLRAARALEAAAAVAGEATGEEEAEAEAEAAPAGGMVRVAPRDEKGAPGCALSLCGTTTRG